MKSFLFITSILASMFSYAQLDSLKVGTKWNFEHSYIRDADNPDYPDHPVQLHNIVYYEGLAKVTYNNKVGFIDTNKTIAIPLIYEDDNWANKFIHSKCVVLKDKKWGVIDTAGATAIPFLYDWIKRFDDLYCVGIDYKWGYLDSAGNTILPIRGYNRSYIMTEKEIFDLAAQYQQKDSLENSIPISRKKAINIAKRKGYYLDHARTFTPSVELNLDSNEWIITSTERKGTTRSGDCANTNGCIVQLNYRIVIDSNTGNVKQKSKDEVLIPVYE